MSDERIREYFKRNIGESPIKKLKHSLIEAGFARSDVEDAAREFEGDCPEAPSNDRRDKPDVEREIPNLMTRIGAFNIDSSLALLSCYAVYYPSSNFGLPEPGRSDLVEQVNSENGLAKQVSGYGSLHLSTK